MKLRLHGSLIGQSVEGAHATATRPFDQSIEDPANHFLVEKAPERLLAWSEASSSGSNPLSEKERRVIF